MDYTEYKMKIVENLTSKKLWGFLILLVALLTVLILGFLTSDEFANVLVVAVPAFFASNAYQDRQNRRTARETEEGD